MNLAEKGVLPNRGEKQLINSWMNPTEDYLCKRAGQKKTDTYFEKGETGPQSKRDLLESQLGAIQKIYMSRNDPATFTLPQYFPRLRF